MTGALGGWNALSLLVWMQMALSRAVEKLVKRRGRPGRKLTRSPKGHILIVSYNDNSLACEHHAVEEGHLHVYRRLSFRDRKNMCI